MNPLFVALLICLATSVADAADTPTVGVYASTFRETAADNGSVQERTANARLVGRVDHASVRAPEGGGCEHGTPGIIVHDTDDGFAEMQAGWNSDVTDGRFANKFTPSVYPASFSSVCLAFMGNPQGPPVSTVVFNLVIYADDGPGGSPGTLLGSKFSIGSVAPPPTFPDPMVPTFQSFDISDLALNITSGSVYIGVQWDASVEGQTDVTLLFDYYPTTPVTSWAYSSISNEWILFNGSSLIRVVQSNEGGPSDATVAEEFVPATVAPNTPSTLTITLTNGRAAAATLNAALVIVLPDGVTLAPAPNESTTCEGGAFVQVSTPPFFVNDNTVFELGGNDAVIPASGTCMVMVDVVASNAGTYVNTIDVGSLQTTVGNNVLAATATLTVSENDDPIFEDGFDGSTP